ncbi:DUF4179 domain-containing protein [Alkaliphilus sp. MSJ-5]|uniref:DUF4179 domain-containing protein n=1 Tax=Alkaliphilus flagellatus TaxID=2841507 RepID=A0ABS6FXV4_9FIRM|nr:DUF4179 domain-containing protein [Alkaliphilus flagellatus]MBU5674909.1 DUF4179 domain-containing protein [Alkaliphilus flagellatus]
MKKNIYDLLNEVEMDLNEYNKEEFTDIEKRKIKNIFKKSIRKNTTLYKKYVSTASIGLLVVTLFTTNLGDNVLSYANTLAYDIVSYLGIEKSLDEYKTVVNQSISKNGLTIQLNEVVLDNDQLVVSATSKYNEKLENDSISLSSSIYINGERVNNGGSGSSKQLDDYTVEEVMFHNIKNDIDGDLDYLNGDLNVKVVFSDPIINGKTVSGQWAFEFKTNGDELALNTKDILLDYSFKLDNDQEIILEKYTSNNLGQKIYFSKESEGIYYDMLLKGHDDLGNQVEFSMSSANAYNGMFKLETINGNLDKNAKKLYLTPYAVKFPDKSGRMSNDFKKVGEEFTINLLK